MINLQELLLNANKMIYFTKTSQDYEETKSIEIYHKFKDSFNGQKIAPTFVASDDSGQVVVIDLIQLLHEN